METAVQLKSLGLSPVIVEKKGSLGGHVAQWNRLFPDMTPASKVLEPYEMALKEVDIYTDTEIASINYLQKGYTVVLSNGKNLRCKAVVRVPMSVFPPNRRRSDLCTAWARAM